MELSKSEKSCCTNIADMLIQTEVWCMSEMNTCYRKLLLKLCIYVHSSFDRLLAQTKVIYEAMTVSQESLQYEHKTV